LNHPTEYATDPDLHAARIGLAAIVVSVGGWIVASRIEHQVAGVKRAVVEAPASEVARPGRARLVGDAMWAKTSSGKPFALVDHTGVRRSLGDFRGKFVVLYFGYASCRDICPTDLFYIAEMVRSFGTTGDQIQPVFITIDPERDTPDQLKRYIPYFHPRFVGLTGNVDEIRGVADRYKVYFAKLPVSGSPNYLMDRSADTLLLDREGNVLRAFPSGTKADRLTEGIRAQLR
jgi:cytochrome oxidase Cu insertion factor (SCO1/SenC/PrrC family)